MPTLPLLIRLAGVCQLAILGVSALVPKMLDWNKALRDLSPFMRRLMWVYGAFIVLTVAGMGMISIVNADSLALSGLLARSVCSFIAVFWLARLAVQLFVFDARPILRGSLMTAGYHILTVVFTALASIYGWAAIFPGK